MISSRQEEFKNNFEIEAINVGSSRSKTISNNRYNDNQLEFSMEGFIPGVPKNKTDKDIFKIFGEAFHNYEERIACKTIEENILTRRNDLCIEICSPLKVTSGIFSTFQYTIKTNPLEYNVIRKLSDFESLFEIIPKYNNAKFNPLLPDFPIRLADDSEKKLLFLRFYLNSLVEDAYYRSLPIVLDFLKLPQSEWDIKLKKYQKDKEIKEINKMANFNGYYDIKISYEDDFKAMKIKEDIKKKDEAFTKLNDNFDELIQIMKKMSVCLKNISQDFNNLKNLYYDNNTQSTQLLGQCFQNLNSIIKTWGEDYVKQRIFLKNEFKYFYKYINKENNSFLKNFKIYEDIKGEYEKKFSKFQKIPMPSDRDRESILNLKRLYGHHLVHIMDEYNKLSERQGTRVNKQFFLYSKEKEILFQDYNNFNKLFKIRENYTLPDVSMSYSARQSDFLNLNLSKISKSQKIEKNNFNKNIKISEVEEKEEIEDNNTNKERTTNSVNINNRYNTNKINNNEMKEEDLKEERNINERNEDNPINNDYNDNNENNDNNEKENEELQKEDAENEIEEINIQNNSNEDI